MSVRRFTDNSIRSGAGCSRFRPLLLALLVATTAGCPEEVAYEPAAPTADEEAPPFEDAAETPAPTNKPEEAAAETLPAPETETETVPPREPPTAAPWMAADRSEAPPAEASGLFGGLVDTEEATSEAPEAEASESFDLNDLYADVEVGEEAEANEPKPKPADLAAGVAPGLGDDLESLWGAPATPQRSEPEQPALPETTAADLPPVTAAIDDFALPEAVETPAAKPPTAAGPAESDVLADLWGDAAVPDAEPIEPSPPPAREAPPLAIDPLPQPEPLPEPPSEPEPDQEPLFAADLPFEDAPEPEPEPEPLPQPPAEPPARVASRQLLGGSGVKPLPAVPVLSYNTRHLAWLLGGKLSLAALADLDGATADEVALWADEAGRLSRELGVAAPVKTPPGDLTDAERVKRLMDHAATLGDAVSIEHGVDHAALLEIALKTNALLVIAKQRPELAAPVAEAIESAADRAMLPSFLWQETVQQLGGEPTADEAYNAIVRLHQRVEQFLR